LKEPEKALEFYTHAEMLSPDDLLISLNIGYCLLELKRYNDALQNFFKIEYLSSDSRKVWRPIAWCSFVVGKLSQAEKYYNKILESERDGQDWLNMGHVALCEGNRKEALARYRKSFIAMKDNHSDFNAAFSEDIPYLLEKGIDKEILPIILDYVYYNE
jgi:tetratricopeptide (TPR) repeat protein